ncbi:zinc-finger domain-containing protein [Mesorhizobium huakuii]|uniref:Zinc-finger domain-containing protein n=1 Tax=Mesorhizobium huakuii TaxID=28104 RepID=A0A7G6T0P1_9HYPH|nr:zinc-finger domain-containing protein [Mesorhizobium huakuii]QND60323.1 zinc-finger domain-containing protein [Mesorhizobium huakuii]
MTAKQATVRTVQLWRDTAGYEIKDYGHPPSDMASLGPSGRCIEGRSAKVVPVVYGIAPGKTGEAWRRASRKLRRVKSLDDLCRFMTEFGPIDQAAGMLPIGAFFNPSCGSDHAGHVELPHAQSLPQVFADGYIRDIAALVDYSASDDSEGFLSAISGTLATRAVLRPMSGALWVTELPSILALLKYDMWCSFGEGRSVPSARRLCANCGTTMHVGDARKRGGKPVTARFCSNKCRVGSHLRQKRIEARRLAGF